MEPNTDTTDIGALADTLHYLWGMDIDIARATLRNHIDVCAKHTLSLIHI